MTAKLSPMPKNKRVPETLLSKLHGKGTMSEVLDIERARLLKQSEQEMQRQLVSTATTHVGPPADTLSASRPSEATQPSVAELSEESRLETEATVSGPSILVGETLALQTVNSEGTPPSEPLGVADVAHPSSHAPSGAQVFRGPETPSVGPEGLSRLSRVVGDDLSEFGTIFRHSVLTVSSHPHFSPEPCQGYYAQTVEPTLAFTTERHLLATIRRLTLGWGTLSCQITLELLSVASGIRNIKTLRKWLGDLHNRRHIRYTPVHGDLRGSIITLTPPDEVRVVVEHWWRDSIPSGAHSSSQKEGRKSV
jgi:hypothetical protein